MPELVSVEAKVAALREPGAHPGLAQPVDVIETHMSWVFLTGQFVYKCERLGAPQLGRALFDAFAESTGDVPDPALVDFCQAFRACVRGNIAIRHLREASSNPRSSCGLSGRPR